LTLGDVRVVRQAGAVEAPETARLASAFRRERKRVRLVRKLLAILALSFAIASPARSARVALTFDDLPILGKVASTKEAASITRRLLSGLRRNHLPATGFVNEIKLEGADRPQRIALLALWLDAGEDLGNHTYSHVSLTNTPVDTYIADVARGETVTRVLLRARGRDERWFRHPYLETGPTLAIRHRFEGWLADNGYRVAPVTMENSDWQFALPYDDAVTRGDTAEATRIRRAYLAYTVRIVAWYQQAALGLLGRKPAFVFLLHASRLNADCIDALARILIDQKLQAITLDRAVADPAYRLADDYAGPDGDGWLTRWASTLHKELPWARLPQVPEDIVASSARLDAIPAPPLPAPR
jgi:peptidoglycan/xylan/chitin deacetylase (PgdA/CDA1 family)